MPAPVRVVLQEVPEARPVFVVGHHPTTAGDNVPVGEILVVRDLVADGGFLVAKVTRVEDELLHVHFYEEIGQKWSLKYGSDDTGEVEKSAILARGNILSLKNTIKKAVLTEVRRQLLAEKSDRLLKD